MLLENIIMVVEIEICLYNVVNLFSAIMCKRYFSFTYLHDRQEMIHTVIIIVVHRNKWWKYVLQKNYPV